MKKIALMACMLVMAVAANAQFEKGKWMLNPSVTGLNLMLDTETDKTTFGMDVKGGAFIVDNLALMVNVGAQWNEREGDRDLYNAGVGIRYYFDKVGVFVGTNFNVDHYAYSGDRDDKTDCSFGLEAGYAYFLCRNVTLEPAVYWNVNDDRSRLGIKLGFGFYF